MYLYFKTTTSRGFKRLSVLFLKNTGHKWKLWIIMQHIYSDVLSINVHFQIDNHNNRTSERGQNCLFLLSFWCASSHLVRLHKGLMLNRFGLLKRPWTMAGGQFCGHLVWLLKGHHAESIWPSETALDDSRRPILWSSRLASFKVAWEEAAGTDIPGLENPWRNPDEIFLCCWGSKTKKKL
jgi:hypothetical protein